MQRDCLMPHRWGTTLGLAALSLAATLAIHSPARADVDVRFDVGRAPRGNFVLFRNQPHRIYDRSSGVYVIDDADIGDNDAFQYGGYYWVFRNGYWYRSSNWRSGFEVVSPQYVPTQLYRVPSYRWHHHPSYASWHNRMDRRTPYNTYHRSY